MTPSSDKYADLRVNYGIQELTESNLSKEPFEQFEVWFDEALSHPLIKEANTMALATSQDNIPSVRIVLLKGILNKAILFYTNYDSEKGKAIAANPKASVLFFWDALERQVRISGNVVKASPDQSDKYFYSRPEDSQLGAMVSPQSQVIPNREYLDEEFAKAKQQEKITRPANWGGYLLQPNKFEFWQGRANRMHDRLVYEQDNEEWNIFRLAP